MKAEVKLEWTQLSQCIEVNNNDWIRKVTSPLPFQQFQRNSYENDYL